MKRNMLVLALVLGSAIRGLCDAPASGDTEARKFLYEDVLGTVELLDVIKPDATPLAPGYYKLSREWVGTLAQIEDKLARTKLAPKKPESLRLNCIRVVPDSSEIYLMGAWFDDAGGVAGFGYRLFRFMRTPRSPAEILQTREFDTLKSWFGDAHSHAGGFGSPGEFSWAQGWTFFSLGQNETILCQDIYAHVTKKLKSERLDATTRAFLEDVNGAKDTRAPSTKDVPDGMARVDIMTYSEGVFRPANPDSEEEHRMYPSEYEKHMAWLAKENARIDAYPEPLRSLIRARHTPDKFSELLAYKAAINRFRAKPEPLLIRQLVERLDEGTGEMSMFLETLMDESMGTNYLKLDPWKPENKKIAVAALIDSLPEAPERSADKVIAMILADTSLVTLEMPEFHLKITALPRTPKSGGYGYSSSGGDTALFSGAYGRTLLNRIASELRRRWEAGGFCVERYSAPAAGK